MRRMQGIEHYENFPVASWLCPPALRAPIVALYHFARTGDDLADEGQATAAQRLADLQAYRAELTACAALSPPEQAALSGRWPQVFHPLAQAIHDHQLPLALLHQLLDAFEQDVVYTERQQRYTDRGDLLAYCERSANPIGRLLLHLHGVRDEVALQQSDAICSALQLINFWQDRSQDIARGRDYLPTGNDVRTELAFAHMLMHRGMPLVHRLPGRFGWELRLVVQGGLRILEKLHALSDADLAHPLTQPRPKLRTWDWPVIAWRALRMTPRSAPIIAAT
jgi:squalene synthase HpnC